ncbi:sel1 repeat family protein [Paraglaciecola sp. MB-3u-78]|nr:sel1 repeat family protein [Paraglaciecola sp. MB-3u-78]
MARTIKLKKNRPQTGYILGLFCLLVQMSAAAERWQIVVLPDTNYNTPNALPTLADYHRTISQGLTIALTNADFDVLNLHYLGLPNCMLEDCSTLSDQAIQQAAKRSGKEVNLALLYQLNAFKQRQPASQKWYFSLSGRLLDLQSGAQQDAFTVDNWVNYPTKNCIGDCLSMWVNQNLSLLAQDLGTVLSEKLEALPRRFHYRLNINDFNSAEIQQIDSYLKNIDGYVADLLLSDSQNTNLTPSQNINRSYQYISELTASELDDKLEKLNRQYALPLTFEYDNTQRQFDIIRTQQTDPWGTFSQLITDLFPSSEQKVAPLPITQEPSPLTVMTESQQLAADENKKALRDQQMWQQASGINTSESYQQYLTIWPHGQHFIQAKAAIKAFQDDKNSWQQASNIKTSHAFQQYLTSKPTGKYRIQAKQQLALLREQQQREQKQQENKTLADDYYYQQQNYPEALYYYQQAAKLGDVSSQYLLGKMYADAKGTEQNMRQAENWYTQAAKDGHSKAQATLGFMYSKGNGVNQDYSQAVNWYQKAAQQGHVNAQYNLAYLYSLGQGVVKDYQQAAYWYQKSANQGDADAQNSLGKLYERGLGVTKNLVKAKKLYQQAATQGNQIAQLNLQMLNN